MHLGPSPLASASQESEVKTEYRVWNPFRSKIAAAVLGGVDNIWMAPGSKVLYLGAASGTSVSHVADIVGEAGTVYAVEFSHRPGRDLINMAKKRTNVIPIIEDARHPLKYRMLVGMVDVIFADVAQPDQARIVALNAHLFLKNEGHCVISIKANCIDSTAAPEAVFAKELKRLKEENFKPLEQITLEPYERDHAVVRARATAARATAARVCPPCALRARALTCSRLLLARRAGRGHVPPHQEEVGAGTAARAKMAALGGEELRPDGQTRLAAAAAGRRRQTAGESIKLMRHSRTHTRTKERLGRHARMYKSAQQLTARLARHVLTLEAARFTRAMNE